MRYPIGDVIMHGIYKAVDESTRPQFKYQPSVGYVHLAQSQLWWCPEEEVENVKSLAKIYTDDGGFSFHVGELGRGSEDIPEVIEHEWQERRPGMLHTTSCNGEVALVGYRMVWLEIEDTEKAYDTLSENSNLPCAVRCNIMLYSQNDRYRQVFEIANEYFITYLMTGKIKDTRHTVIDEREHIRSMYDV